MNNDHGRVSLLIFPTPDLDVDRLYIDRAWLPGAPWGSLVSRRKWVSSCHRKQNTKHHCILWCVPSKTQNTIEFCGVSLVKKMDH